MIRLCEQVLHFYFRLLQNTIIKQNQLATIKLLKAQNIILNICAKSLDISFIPIFKSFYLYKDEIKVTNWQSFARAEKKL